MHSATIFRLSLNLDRVSTNSSNDLQIFEERTIVPQIISPIRGNSFDGENREHFQTYFNKITQVSHF